jgi:hypothetical protein
MACRHDQRRLRMLSRHVHAVAPVATASAAAAAPRRPAPSFTLNETGGANDNWPPRRVPPGQEERHSFDEYMGGANLSGVFDHTQKTFLRQWPGEPGKSYRGSFAAQSPSSNYFVIAEGGGAEGSDGFLALAGANSAEFYVEASPVWNRPRRVFDLRHTVTSVHLKSITPIVVNPGYRPYLFIANVASEPYATKSDIVAFIHRVPLVVGEDDWHYNEVDMEPDDTSAWLCYSAGSPNRRADTPTGSGQSDDSVTNKFRPIESVMAQCGFVGVMYCNLLSEAAPLCEIEFPPQVGARGILGIDELCFNRSKQASIAII